MDNHIVQNFFRGEDQTPVKVQVAFAAAASPACLLLADGDPPVGDIHDSCVISGLFRKDISCDGNISGAVLFRERRALL